MNNIVLTNIELYVVNYIPPCDTFLITEIISANFKFHLSNNGKLRVLTNIVVTNFDC